MSYGFTSSDIPLKYKVEDRPGYIQDPSSGRQFHYSSKEGQMLIASYYARKAAEKQAQQIQTHTPVQLKEQPQEVQPVFSPVSATSLSEQITEIQAERAVLEKAQKSLIQRSLPATKAKEAALAEKIAVYHSDLLSYNLQSELEAIRARPQYVDQYGRPIEVQRGGMPGYTMVKEYFAKPKPVPYLVPISEQFGLEARQTQSVLAKGISKTGKRIAELESKIGFKEAPMALTASEAKELEGLYQHRAKLLEYGSPERVASMAKVFGPGTFFAGLEATGKGYEMIFSKLPEVTIGPPIKGRATQIVTGARMLTGFPTAEEYYLGTGSKAELQQKGRYVGELLYIEAILGAPYGISKLKTALPRDIKKVSQVFQYPTKVKDIIFPKPKSTFALEMTTREYFETSLTLKKAGYELTPKMESDIAKAIYKPPKTVVKPVDVEKTLGFAKKQAIQFQRQFTPYQFSKQEKSFVPELKDYLMPTRGGLVQVQKPVHAKVVFGGGGSFGFQATEEELVKYLGGTVGQGRLKIVPITEHIPESYLGLAKGLAKTLTVSAPVVSVAVTDRFVSMPTEVLPQFKEFQAKETFVQPMFRVIAKGPALESFAEQRITPNLQAVLLGKTVGEERKQTEKIGEMLKQENKAFSKVIESKIMQPIERQAEITAQAEVYLPAEALRAISLNKIAFREIQRQVNLEKQVYKQVKRFDYRELTKTKVMERESLKEKEKIVPPPIILLPITFESLKPEPIPKPQTMDRAFQAFVRRQGKLVPVSPPTFEEAAAVFGKKAVIETLARSYIVLPVKGLPIPTRRPRLPVWAEQMFRPAKTTKLAGFTVEKARYALDLPTERQAIQRARKMTMEVFR